MEKAISIRKMKSNCDAVSTLLKALAHPGRLMIMGHLSTGRKSVSELQSLSGISQSQLSQFLNRMRLEKLVSCQREGRFQYYSAADPKILKLIRSIQTIFCD